MYPRSEKEVLKSVLNRLDIWERRKVVRWHERLNSGMIMVGRRPIRMCKPGTVDCIAVIDHKSTAYLYLIECKNSSGGKFTGNQDIFKNRFNGLNNVIHEIVCHPDMIDVTIEKLTNYSHGTLDNIDIFGRK